VPDYTAALDGNVKGLKLGLPREYLKDLASETGDLIQGGVAALQRLGCEVREISLPATDYAIACYYIIATAEASSNLARYDGVRYTRRAATAGSLADMYRRTRGEGFGAECKRRIMLGTYVLSAGYYDAYYLKAQKVRALIARDFAIAFEQVDAIVAPVSPFPAFKIGEKVDDPLAMYLSDIYTITGSLAGIPCMSVPCGPGGNADFDPAFRRAHHVPSRRCLRTSEQLNKEKENSPCHSRFPHCPTRPTRWSRTSTP
jgi:aspartyl-tRNA(Asn)/glutamyl-tRNA(Gln) amidotransferase subunit A